MSNLYNERKQQQRDDKARAESISPTAFVPVPGGEVYDYGEFAGAGSSDLTALSRDRIEAGVMEGRLAAFDAFLRAQTDPLSRWLVTFDPIGNPRAFNDALAEWVRKWDDVGLGRIVREYVDVQRKP